MILTTRSGRLKNAENATGSRRCRNAEGASFARPEHTPFSADRSKISRPRQKLKLILDKYLQAKA
jgi:hypothetical protein